MGPPDESFTRAAYEGLVDEARNVARLIAERVRRLVGPPAPLRVLVVDDHRDAADALAALLEMLGFEVRTCYDGPTTLAVADEWWPDIALLDLMMPGMDGLAVGTALRGRAKARSLFLVATTALGDIEAQARTALVGFHAHLVKPVDMSELVDTLGRFEAVLRPRVDVGVPNAPTGNSRPS